jgi:tetratricopeptide (TPR) repeat protein
MKPDSLTSLSAEVSEVKHKINEIRHVFTAGQPLTLNDINLWADYADFFVTLRNDRLSLSLLLKLADNYIAANEPLVADKLLDWLKVNVAYYYGLFYSFENKFDLMRTHFSAGLELLTHPDFGIEKPETRQVTLEANLRIGLARTLAFSGELDAAQQSLEQATQIVQAYGLEVIGAKVSLAYSAIYQLRGQNEEAVAFSQMALQIARRHNDSRIIASALERIGTYHLYHNRPEEAIESYQEAVTVSQQIGLSTNLGIIYNNLAVAQLRLERTGAALDAFQLALNLYKQRGDRPNSVLVLSNIGSINQKLNRNYEAREAFSRSLQLARELNEPTYILTALGSLAACLASTTDAAVANEVRGYLAEAESLIDATGAKINPNYLATTYHSLANAGSQLAATEADYNQVAHYRAQATELYHQIGLQSNVEELNTELATILLHKKDQPNFNCVREMLADWWEQVKTSNAELSPTQLDLALHYAERLNVWGEPAKVVAVCDYLPLEFIVEQASQDLKRQLEDAYLAAAAHAKNPADGVQFLEKGLQLAKSGVFKPQRSKDYQELLKNLKKSYSFPV